MHRVTVPEFPSSGNLVCVVGVMTWILVQGGSCYWRSSAKHYLCRCLACSFSRRTLLLEVRFEPLINTSFPVNDYEPHNDNTWRYMYIYNVWVRPLTRRMADMNWVSQKTTKNYLIGCKQCHKQYVGQTTWQLNHGISRHRTNIRTMPTLNMSLHFNIDH